MKSDAGHGIYRETLIFNLDMPSAVGDVRNNVYQATSITVGALGKLQAIALGKGKVNMMYKWVSPCPSGEAA